MLTILCLIRFKGKIIKIQQYRECNGVTVCCHIERFSFECGKVIGFAFVFGFHAT